MLGERVVRREVEFVRSACLNRVNRSTTKQWLWGTRQTAQVRPVTFWTTRARTGLATRTAAGSMSRRIRPSSSNLMTDTCGMSGIGSRY